MERTSENKMFGGQQLQYRHNSVVLDCEMLFSIFLPPQAKLGPVPVLYWLSGLTCTDQNFVTKAGAQQHATEHGIAIVCPDTSPRGETVPDDPEGSWDFGLGAGFYVNATQKPWLSNYQMYDYVVSELPALVNEQFPIDGANAGVSGHSMGGHGALTIALNNPEVYQSVSAFSPIVAPSQVPWGNKALSNYLGPEESAWMKHDACKLISQASHHLPILVDQGDADTFLEEQLRTHLLQEAADKADYPITIRMQPGYDHSYFFIASFIGEHIAFHANALND